MKKFLLTAMIGALAFGNASAADWGWTSVDQDRTFILLVNNDSIDCEGKICSAWVAAINIDPKLNYDLEQSYIEVDCKKMKDRWVHSSQYLRGNRVKSFPEETTFEIVPLGTMRYANDEYICKKSSLHSDFKGSPFEIVKPVQDYLRKQQKLMKQ